MIAPQTSRELAERFFNGYIELVRDYQPLMTPEQFIGPLTETIETYVRVREAEIIALAKDHMFSGDYSRFMSANTRWRRVAQVTRVVTDETPT